MIKDVPVIKCKTCGHEYMPSEIYMPDAFFGKQKDVIRNSDGTINFYIGDDPDFTEEFICESCGSHLTITADVTFNVEVDKKKETFEEVFETPINKPKKIKLDEVDIF